MADRKRRRGNTGNTHRNPTHFVVRACPPYSQGLELYDVRLTEDQTAYTFTTHDDPTTRFKIPIQCVAPHPEFGGYGSYVLRREFEDLSRKVDKLGRYIDKSMLDIIELESNKDTVPPHDHDATYALTDHNHDNVPPHTHVAGGVKQDD